MSSVFISLNNLLFEFAVFVLPSFELVHPTANEAIATIVSATTVNFFTNLLPFIINLLNINILSIKILIF